jgi:hypothetical protein
LKLLQVWAAANGKIKEEASLLRWMPRMVANLQACDASQLLHERESTLPGVLAQLRAPQVYVLQ